MTSQTWVAADAAVINTNKKVVIKRCAPFTHYICETNNAQVDNGKGIDVVMLMYNLIEYSDNYSKRASEVYGNTLEMGQLYVMLTLLLVFLMIIIVLRFHLKKE